MTMDDDDGDKRGGVVFKRLRFGLLEGLVLTTMQLPLCGRLLHRGTWIVERREDGLELCTHAPTHRKCRDGSRQPSGGDPENDSGSPGT